MASMTVKKAAVATVTGGVAMWLLAGLWHLVLVPGFYAGRAGASHHDGGWMIAVGYLLLAAVMAVIYPIGYRGGKPLIEGLRFGLLIGLLWVTPHALVRMGAHAGGEGGSISYLLINGAWHLIEQGAGGIIVALIYSAKTRPTTTGVAEWRHQDAYLC